MARTDVWTSGFSTGCCLSGAQAAIAALILALTEPGDVILAKPTSYPGLRAAATHFGRHIIAVEADKHGMVPEMLEEACRQHKPGVIYLNPTLQNPTAITIPERRRKELASIAKRCNVRIVEDDPYWLLADVLWIVQGGHAGLTKTGPVALTLAPIQVGCTNLCTGSVHPLARRPVSPLLPALPNRNNEWWPTTAILAVSSDAA